MTSWINVEKLFLGWQYCFETALSLDLVFRWLPPKKFHIAYAFWTLSLNLLQFLLLSHSHFYSWYVYDVEMCSRFCWFHSFPYIIAIEVGSCICKCMYKLPPPFSLSHTSSFQLSSWRASFFRKWWQVKANRQISTLHYLLHDTLLSTSLFSYEFQRARARCLSLSHSVIHHRMCFIYRRKSLLLLLIRVFLNFVASICMWLAFFCSCCCLYYYCS